MPTKPVQAHPAALLFSEQARRAVAGGPLFLRGYHPLYPFACGREDDRCVVGALLVEDGLMPTTDPLTRPNEYQSLSYLPAELRTRANLGHLCDLNNRNDRARYAHRDKLVGDLLGEVTP